MRKKRIIRFGMALMLLGALASVNSAAAAVPVSHAVVCTSASAWGITPNESGGADFTIANGAGYCLQGIPFEGDWSFLYQGTGSAESLTCTPFPLVTGLVLDVTILFHNNKNGNTETVHEVWTQLLPISPQSVATMTIAPGGFLAQIETRVFLACPPAGSPSTYVQWLDANPPR